MKLSLESAGDVAMTFTTKTGRQRMFARLQPAVITGMALCVANYSIDFVMDRVGISGSKTILNDLAVGILGALAVFFYLSTSYERQNFENAKGRIILIGELNLRIREALGVLANSALSEDRFARLSGIDEATDASTTSSPSSHLNRKPAAHHIMSDPGRNR
jgi:hypothetical protein